VLAGAVARRLISDAARSADATIRRAADAASRARWAEVQQTLSSAAAGDLHASRLRALARLAAEEYAAAAADLQQEFLARPDDAAVAFVLGWARVGAADDTAAISAFRSAAFLEPTLVPAHLAIAEIYVRIRQPALAIQALEAGLANVPNSPELTSMLAAVRK
jgi:predicted Zn-dependent protease